MTISLKMPTKPKPRPTKNQSSRRFGDEPQIRPRERRLETESSNYFSRNLQIPRSTSYTTPLPLGDGSELSRGSAPLTRANLESHLGGLEKQKSAPPSLSSVAGDQGHMRKTKSPKKSDKKKSKPDPNSHPLNLPPDELRRLSAAMAREEARNSTPMDVENEDSMTNRSSAPQTPSHDAPGAFPDAGANGFSDHDEKSPTPPPHQPPPPKVDPEACKAAGNKFFKAKDYDRAVQEYSKGKTVESQVRVIANRSNSCGCRTLKSNLPIESCCGIHLRQQVQPSTERLSPSQQTRSWQRQDLTQAGTNLHLPRSTARCSRHLRTNIPRFRHRHCCRTKSATINRGCRKATSL